MKTCLTYTHGLKYLDETNEIIIDYNPKDTTIFEFCESYTEQTIIFDIASPQDISLILNDSFEFSKIAALNEKYTIKIRLPEYLNDSVLLFKKMNENNMKVFFNEYINNWEKFFGFIELGVSDIYITEILGLSIADVAYYAHKKNINIRIFPNVCQRGSIQVPAISSFYIRPEDLAEYESYVDIIEFWYFKPKQQEVYYKVYNIDKKWFGPLHEIISDLDSSVDSRDISPTFVKSRINCGRQCLINPLSHCKICYRTELNSKILLNLREKQFSDGSEEKD